MYRGYIALWRRIEEHKFYKEKREFSKLEAWIDLLMQAQHEKEPQEVIFGMTILQCNYGESLKSIRTWSKRWCWGTAKVHRFLKLLKNMKQIRYRSETVTTRITILNYEKYDPKNDLCETLLKRERNASETRANLDKNEKNEKNVNPPLTPPGGKRGYQPPFGTELKSSHPWLNPSAWDDFVQHRKNIKHPLTELAVSKSINLLQSYPDRQQDIVDETIRNNWRGLFAPKNNGKPPPGSSGKMAKTVEMFARRHFEREQKEQQGD